MFSGFISYSRKNAHFARHLHKRLEAYRIPKGLRNLRAEKLGRFFLDQNELPASASLTAELQKQLLASDALIVISSPEAAASEWVNKEIEYFKDNCPERKIFCVIVSGDPPECFPPSLRDDEPLAPDFRSSADGEELGFAKLVAGLLNVNLGELQNRELLKVREERRRFALISSSLIVLSVVSLVSVALATFLFKQSENREIRAQQFATQAGDIANDVITDMSALTIDEALSIGTFQRLSRTLMSNLMRLRELGLTDFESEYNLIEMFRLFALSNFDDETASNEALARAEQIFDEINIPPEQSYQKPKLEIILKSASAQLACFHGSCQKGLNIYADALSDLDEAIDTHKGLIARANLYMQAGKQNLDFAKLLEAHDPDYPRIRRALNKSIGYLTEITVAGEEEKRRKNMIADAEATLKRIPTDDSLEAKRLAAINVCRSAFDYWEANRTYSGYSQNVLDEFQASTNCMIQSSSVGYHAGDIETVCRAYHNLHRQRYLADLMRDKTHPAVMANHELNMEMSEAYFAVMCGSPERAADAMEDLRSKMEAVQKEYSTIPAIQQTLEKIMPMFRNYELLLEQDGLQERDVQFSDGRYYYEPPDDSPN
ncbi:MAG: hypothetical protein CMK09_08420 [Ponticaulis sp.]|nr:hypothetical protein [Ponticaulis sp.]|tara:strand:- start:2513 stop:4321 length:1809 start_codon:yes stop_codon:yes gene_type:complete